MRLRKIIFFLVLSTSYSCRDENRRPTLSVCNNMLDSCFPNNANGMYCTFGYKYGNSNPFSPAGLEIPGPGVKATNISYKFQDAGLTFHSHSQERLTSLSLSEIDKSEIRLVISEWESVANINFVEKKSTEKSDITIILANIEQGGLGYPAFVGEPCNQIAGYVVLGTRSTLKAKLFLHEMGHVLGLGHVSSDNVMNPDRTYEHLQPGDVMGIQSIYGSK